MLQKEINKCNESDNFVIVGEFNLSEGKQPIHRAIGYFGEAVINNNRDLLR